jgi:serine/threonine-protein kinase
VEQQRIGNYRLVELVERDASGSIYEARHLLLPRRAIVKVGATAERDVMLLREACLLDALEHAGVVRVFESGLLAERRAWFACELVEGRTVDEMLDRGPIDPVRAVGLVRDVAEVLEHAHRRGVVHCGLRPDVIVMASGSRGYPVCIVDWSDARAHDTQSRGTVPVLREYVAPEVLQGAPIDDRVDVFSLGVIAYQALTGSLPFDGQTLAKGVDGSAQHVPTTVRCPEVPPELATLVDQMLAADRWDRPSSAEVRADLTELARDLADASPHASGSMRIRAPRWTPSVPMVDSESGPIAFALAIDESETRS